MELTLDTVAVLMGRMDAAPVDARLRKELEEADRALKAQGPDARYVLPPDLEGAVNTLIAARAPLSAPGYETMDVEGAQALFDNMEKLILLFAALSRENRELNREMSYSELQNRVKQITQSASKRMEGAQQLRSSGIGALAMSIVGGLVGMVGGGVGARFSLKGSFASDVVQSWHSGAQGATQIFGGASSLAGNEGAVRNQEHQAEADTMQARSERSNAEFQRSLTYENEFKDLMAKMNELLRSMQEARLKSAEAAARA